ncbi:MAG: hypothetical protein ACE5Q6_09835 [Dehalococcoidia bacterium]
MVAQVVLRSASGASIVQDGLDITAGTVAKYHADSETIEAARIELSNLGFEILQSSPISLTISEDRALFEQTFGTKLQEHTHGGGTDTSQQKFYFEAVEPIQIPAELANLVEAIIFPVPATPFGP